MQPGRGDVPLVLPPRRRARLRAREPEPRAARRGDAGALPRHGALRLLRRRAHGLRHAAPLGARHPARALGRAAQPLGAPPRARVRRRHGARLQRRRRLRRRKPLPDRRDGALLHGPRNLRGLGRVAPDRRHRAALHAGLGLRGGLVHGRVRHARGDVRRPLRALRRRRRVPRALAALDLRPRHRAQPRRQPRPLPAAVLAAPGASHRVLGEPELPRARAARHREHRDRVEHRLRRGRAGRAAPRVPHRAQPRRVGDDPDGGPLQRARGARHRRPARRRRGARLRGLPRPGVGLGPDEARLPPGRRRGGHAARGLGPPGVRTAGHAGPPRRPPLQHDRRHHRPGRAGLLGPREHRVGPRDRRDHRGPRRRLAEHHRQLRRVGRGPREAPQRRHDGHGAERRRQRHRVAAPGRRRRAEPQRAVPRRPVPPRRCAALADHGDDARLRAPAPRRRGLVLARRQRHAHGHRRRARRHRPRVAAHPPGTAAG